MFNNRSDFMQYLTDTLIPDLIESGHEATAEDFQTAIDFMSYPSRDAKVRVFMHTTSGVFGARQSYGHVYIECACCGETRHAGGFQREIAERGRNRGGTAAAWTVRIDRSFSHPNLAYAKQDLILKEGGPRSKPKKFYGRKAAVLAILDWHGIDLPLPGNV